MLEKLQLEGRVAVVTGGSGGLGRAIAIALAEAGANIVVNGRRAEAGEQTVVAVRKIGQDAVFIKADVTKTDEINNLMLKAIEQWGRVDILANCAGIVKSKIGESTSISRKLLWELTDEEWHTGMDTNLTSAFFCTRAISKHMAEMKSGRIINISSGFGYRGLKNAFMYTAAKAGLITLTMSLSLTLAEYGVNVNSIAPGLFRTYGTKDRYDASAKYIPIGYVGEPAEVGGLAVYLASDASGYVTGETFIIDGGALANGAAPSGYIPAM
jgi:3-oxoacyl-[acyl-carrier protein] reductase